MSLQAKEVRRKNARESRENMVKYRPLHTGNAGKEGRNNMRRGKG
jgi:hypothetical protein